MSTITAPPATAAGSITIDRNARKALLAALSLRLNRYERIERTLRERDRALLADARETFDHMWPILDGLDYWESETAPAVSYSVPASKWLRELVTDFANQTRDDLDGDEQELSEVADRGEAPFEAGGEQYDPQAEQHPRVQRREWIARMRLQLESEADELIGMESILAMLANEQEDENR